jgi:cell division protein FtsW (lipid II flippase)
VFLFLILIFLAHVGGIGSRIDGRVAYINLGAIHISICSLMMLYIPLYGAIIYKYHGMGYRGLIKSLIWLIVSVFIALRLTDIGVAIMVLVSMAAVLSIAIWEDWFSVARKKIIAGLWGCIGGFSILILCVPLSFGGIASYQVERLRAFITNGGATDYFTTKLRSTFFSSKIWGNGGKDISGQLPNLNNDYIITFLTSTYGIIIGIVVCCILVTLTVKVFSVSVKQKNQLGMIMGCGCGMVFFINIMINILENMGLLPTMQTFLPFFSIAGSNIIACYILIGIALSVYRYKNIFPKHVDKKDITSGIRING